jgi:hypothetical protein
MHSAWISIALGIQVLKKEKDLTSWSFAVQSGAKEWRELCTVQTLTILYSATCTLHFSIPFLSVHGA